MDRLPGTVIYMIIHSYTAEIHTVRLQIVSFTDTDTDT